MAGSAETVYAEQVIPPDVVEQLSVPHIGKEKTHAFISHHNNDEKLVQHIKSELKKRQFITRIEDDILPGDSKIDAREKFVENARKIVVIISAQYMEDDWNRFEHICALTRNSTENRKLTITILHNVNPGEVPPYAKEIDYIQTTDTNFWARFVAALQSDEVELSAAIPVTDIAEGLAWGYYINYLRLVAPGLKERLQQSNYANENLFEKFIILMPHSGDCSKINQENKYITREKEPLKFKITVSGCQERDYSNSVHTLTHPETGRELLVVMEYATPLWTMYEMEMSCLARLGREGKENEIRQFNKILQDILSRNADFDGLVVPIEYDDTKVKGDEGYLSRTVFTEIDKEITSHES